MTEREAMQRALQLAWNGWGRVHPNPMVGAVVLRDSQVIGEGWHAEFGSGHAEPAALAQASGAARGATLVVTLEPCNHHGKQPPCTEAILDSGIARVVVATPDPNPVASGGAERLRSAGVVVELGLLREQAERQNAPFFHQFRGTSRPFVALKLATSVDGRIADRAGSSRWISGAEAREFVHWLRAGFDAIGVGGRTARVDNASLTVRGAVTPRVSPRRVVFTREGGLDPEGRLAATATEPPVLLVRTAPGGLAPVPAGIDWVQGDDLPAALGALLQAGITSLLVEGGGELAGSLLAAGLVDRFYWVQAPLWLGDRGIPAFQGLASPLLASVDRWRVTERRTLGEDTLLVLDR